MSARALDTARIRSAALPPQEPGDGQSHHHPGPMAQGVDRLAKVEGKHGALAKKWAPGGGPGWGDESSHGRCSRFTSTRSAPPLNNSTHGRASRIGNRATCAACTKSGYCHHSPRSATIVFLKRRSHTAVPRKYGGSRASVTSLLYTNRRSDKRSRLWGKRMPPRCLSRSLPPSLIILLGMAPIGAGAGRGTIRGHRLLQRIPVLNRSAGRSLGHCRCSSRPAPTSIPSTATASPATTRRYRRWRWTWRVGMVSPWMPETLRHRRAHRGRPEYGDRRLSEGKGTAGGRDPGRICPPRARSRRLGA